MLVPASHTQRLNARENEHNSELSYCPAASPAPAASSLPACCCPGTYSSSHAKSRQIAEILSHSAIIVLRCPAASPAQAASSPPACCGRGSRARRRPACGSCRRTARSTTSGCRWVTLLANSCQEMACDSDNSSRTRCCCTYIIQCL